MFIKIIFEILTIKLKRLFNIKIDTDCIPEGTYCYKTINAQCNPPRLNIEPCKYYRHYNDIKNACIYEEFFGFDILLGDQCKICGIKEYDETEDLLSNITLINSGYIR